MSLKNTKQFKPLKHHDGMKFKVLRVNNTIHLGLRLSYLRFAGTVQNKKKDEDITNLYYLGETKSIGTD